MAKSPYTDLPEPLKLHLPALFASYPTLSEPKPSSWFAWNDKYTDAQNSVVCHASMRRYAPGFENLVTAVPNSSELALEYLRMLVRGPFRSMSDLIKLDRVGSNYYLLLSDLGKWPGNVLMNFCIASRTPIEFEYLLSPWASRCDAGFDPTLAFLLAYSYGCHYGSHVQWDKRTFQMGRLGHMWLDPVSSWRAILDGTFTNVSEPFKVNPNECLPTNIIWGYSKDHVELMNMSDEQIADFYHQPICKFEPPPKPVQIKIKKLIAAPAHWGQFAPPQPEVHENDAEDLELAPIFDDIDD